ncbi:MAG: hypothetical protein K1X64_14305 [Myxococcaceae bacterium]|nr:hypothetical protein [Myxococcaceae bacterium]
MLALFAALTFSAAPAQSAPAAKPEAAVQMPPPQTLPPATGVSPGPDFTAEAKLLFRVVACAGNAPLPAHIDAKVVEEHCRELNAKIEKYRKTWVGVAKPFLQGLKPPGLPTTVVYPFGGGDLISALTTYPEAKEITTLSLEHAGDPRRIHSVNAKQLKASLELIRKTSNGLLTANDSKTENLMKGQRGELPGQLSFFLIALAVHGYEPVSLRYVKVNDDGSLRSVMPDDIATLEKKNAQLLHAGWTSPDFSEAFSNAEITFVRAGGNPATEAKVHRHFAENLDDTHFGKDEPLKKHLEAKGNIVAMTKAASYLLWRDNFSVIRNYLLNHMQFMVSDSTGVPPRFATEAGFEQQAYGKFSESFLGAPKEHNDAFRKLWANAPPLEFRYGYLDKSLSKHMLVTKKAAPKP